MIKCYRAVESCSISLPSVLRVQLNHAKHLCENWINPGMILTSPEDTGIWTLDQSLYSPVLQDKDDELYTAGQAVKLEEVHVTERNSSVEHLV